MTTQTQQTGQGTSSGDHAAPRVERVRAPFAARHMQLVSREFVSPGFVRLTLGGADMSSFQSAGFDDHVKLLFAQPGQEKPVLPVMVDGRPHFDGGEKPIARDFTPLRWDAAKGRLVIEFAMHEAGPAAEWAATAPMGQWIGVAGPRGSMVVPEGLSWHWLLGDASALPAIARRLEELPASARVSVRVMLDDPADRRELPTAAQLDLQWVDSLADAAQELRIPQGHGFIWAAGEHSDMSQVRRIVMAKPGVNPRLMRIASYWKRGEVAHHEELNEG